MRFQHRGVIIVWVSVLTGVLSGCGALLNGTNPDVTNLNGSVEALSTSPQEENPPAKCYAPNAATKPASMCGQTGYNYLLKTYVRPQCAGCHHTGSSVHYNLLGDDNDATAYKWGRLVSQALWNQRVSQNPFTYPECNLKQTHQIYKDLQAWLACP